MPFKPIHLLWLLANGPAKVQAFPFLQNQRRETSSVSTPSLDLANIVTPVTLTNTHTNPSTETANTPVGTLKSESQQTSTLTSATSLTVSHTPQPPSGVSSGSQSTPLASTMMETSLITPQPSLAPTSNMSSGPTMGAGIDVHTLMLTVPAIILEHTVTTTVFVIQAPAEPLTLPTPPSNMIQDSHSK